MVLLAWDGPRWAADYMFGNDIDGVGQESTVPTIAAHLVRPWTRIIVQLGHPRTAWQRQDMELAAAVARRLREGDELEVVVLCDDPSTAALLEHEGGRDGGREGIVVVTDAAAQDEVISRVRPTDIVVVPAHYVYETPPWRMRRLVRQLQDTNIAVVAGPHRLTISQGVTTRPLSRVVTPRMTTA